MKFKKPNINWRELFVQMVSDSFGVLFALWINQWQETKRQQKEVSTALQFITNEITENKLLLERRIEYYQSFRQEADSLLSLGTPAMEDMKSFKGINPVYLRKSSFELCLNTGVFQHIDYKLADNISGLYAAQDFYIKAIDMMLDQMLANQSNRSVKTVSGVFGEWSNMGNEIAGYQDTILNLMPHNSTSDN